MKKSPTISSSPKSLSSKRNQCHFPTGSAKSPDKLDGHIKLESHTVVTNSHGNAINSGSHIGGSVAAARLLDLGKRLLEATREGKTDLVRQLVVDHGAPFTSDWLGTTALHVAAQNGFVEIAEILLNGGVNRDAKTKLERTALHLAAQSGCIEIVDLLLSNGADVNARDMLKMTPLHWAVERGHYSVCNRLLVSGADVTIKSKFQLTPLDIAKNSEYYDMIELLGGWLSVGQASGVVCQTFRGSSLNVSGLHQYHAEFKLDQFSHDLNQMFNLGCESSNDEATPFVYHHPSMIPSATNKNSTFRNQHQYQRQTIAATLKGPVAQVPSTTDDNISDNNNGSDELLDFDYQLAHIDPAHGATNGRGGIPATTASLTVDSVSASGVNESLADRCIDLVGLDLEFESEFLNFLKASDSEDDDEANVSYLKKKVEDLQKENKQLRQQVEQLSTTSP